MVPFIGKSIKRHLYRKVDGNLEARMISICELPKGYERWTLRLIAGKCIEDSISHMTVKRTLKRRTYTSPEKVLVHTPKHNAAFVNAMEDVLEVFSHPYDENFAVVCMDEKPLQLLA